MRKMILIPYDKYERLLSGQVSQPKLVNTTDSDAEQDTTDSLQRDNRQLIAQDSTTDDLLPSLPLPLRSRGKTIVNHLKKHADFRWNDKGEIIVDGQLVKGSNIIDLIKIQLKDYKSFHPIGAEVFSQLVRESNIPQSVLSPTRRFQIGTGKIPPPPGKPVRSKPMTRVFRHKWISI